MQYESPITSGKKVMAKVKVFVHSDADARAMTLAPQTFVLARYFQGAKCDKCIYQMIVRCEYEIISQTK